MKKLFLMFFVFLYTFSYSIEYIEKFSDERSEHIDFNFQFDKYVPKDKDHYVFAKKSVNLRAKPTVKSSIVSKLNFHKTIKVTALVENNKKEKWYEVTTEKGKVAYVRKNLVIKREFDFKKAVERAERFNKFIEKNLGNIKVVNKYTPLSEEVVSFKKDKFGNRGSQSIQIYTDKDFKDFIYLPDRSLFVILNETDKYFEIITSAYGEKIYYMPKTNAKYIRNSGIIDYINKFVFVSKHSQNQITYERDTQSGRYNMLSVGYVTTGKDSEFGYATPKGEFLVAISKPTMLYTSDIEKDTIVGDALYAIRFSGGAYLHGIPSMYEPKENREERKKVTASKLGTYPLSHKCVRNEDDSIKFIYQWIGSKSVNKAGHRTPQEPVIVIVD
ncbi:L,D-transpeptidase family protein [Caviibacter abscessus]|uniref:L,D-transpeptidase family protein n=1 Tax=Caviibacter abscessus TaxID=1766719 RepID=UPI00082C989E|nr:SH3 domain-containing protein [Caviibacter abscessus]